MNKETECSGFKQILPVAGLLLSVLAFFADGFPVWVTVVAVSIGVALIIAWLFSETGWIGKALKWRWFKSKLSKDKALRLSVLLDDVGNMMSYSYTLSPFRVWHNYSNEFSEIMKMNYSYYGSVGSWLNDLKGKFSDPGINNILLLDSLSKAILETTKLAENVEHELENLLRNERVTEQTKLRILKEWDSARNHFNGWIGEWRILFKELNKTNKIHCVEHFRTLEMIG